MDLKEFFENSILLSYYKDLLSVKLKNYMEDYFENDFSLSEIARDNGITRQAVYENIKRGVKIINDYEGKLHVYKKEKELKDKLQDLKDDFSIEKLDDILDKVYT